MKKVWAPLLVVAIMSAISVAAQDDNATLEAAGRAKDAALEEIGAISRKVHLAELDDVGRILAARDEDIARLRELADEHKLNAEIQMQAAQTVRDVTIGAEREVAEIREEQAIKEMEALQELDLAREEAHTAEIERRQAETEAGVTASADFFGSLSELAGQASEAQAEAGRSSAVKLFNLQKAAALAEIAINTAVAITKATAQLGPIAGGLATVALVASGAAQAAVVAAQEPPSFPHGGLVGDRIGTDHVAVGARRDEAILNPGATRRLGRAGVDALNRGNVPGAQQVVAVPVFRQSRRFFKDEVSRMGPLRSEVRRGSQRAGAKGY